MAVATKPAPAAAQDRELLISGSEAVAEALTLADIDVVTAYPIRPYDTVMQAIAKKIANGHRVAEDRRVFLPLAISADGAFLTHSQALTMVPPKEKVERFLPRYDRGDLLLHPDNPITVAPQANEDWVIEIRRQNNEAMGRAVGVIEEAYADFRRIFGRGPENPWFEEYMTADAEIILVGMGTISLPI